MSALDETIGVTGASGQLGREVLRQLAGRLPSGVRLVACTRTPDASPAPQLQADEIRRADFADAATLGSAFAGIDRLLLIAIEGPDDERVGVHAGAIRAAVDAGVRHIVYAGFLDVDPASPSTVAQVHRRTEEELKAAGVPWTMLRNGPYLENMVTRIVAAADGDGVFRWSAGDARLPFISRGDLAEAAAHALLKAPENAIFELTGADLLRLDDLCRLISARIGRSVTYRSPSDEEFVEECRAQGLTDDYVARRVAYGQAMRRGFMTISSRDFRDLVGREPRRAADVISDMAFENTKKPGEAAEGVKT